MSNQIFQGVQGITIPNFDYDIEDTNNRFKVYADASEKYLKDIQAWCKKNGKGKYAGGLIKLPVADGYALYVVYSLRPVKLVHIDIYDGYHSPLIDGVTASKIKQLVDSERKMQELFGSAG